MATTKYRELSLQKKEKAVMAAKIRELSLRKSKEKSLMDAKIRKSKEKSLMAAKIRKSKEKPEVAAAHRRLQPEELVAITAKIREARRRRPLLESEKEELSRVRAEVHEVADKVRSCLKHTSGDKLMMKVELGIIFGQRKPQTLTLLSTEESVTSLVESMVGLSEEECTKYIDWAVRVTKYQIPSGSNELLESDACRLKDELRMMRAWSLILVRLPANHLLSYKLVCKVWKSLISSTRFISAHFEHSKSDPSNHFLLIHEVCPRNSVNTFRSAMFCMSPAVVLVGSVNGLICVVANFPGWKFSGDDVWIFNPVTGHIMKLPMPSESPFNYRTDTVAYVFWWDSIADEYKLAKIVSKPDNTTVASLWVSGSPETWIEIHVGFDGAFFNPPSMVSGCDVVIGDVAYWIMFKLIDGRDVGDLFVMSLDLKTMSLSLNENSFPLHFMEPKALCKQLGSKDDFSYVHDGSLLFAATCEGNFALVEKDREKKVYNVWTMDDVAEGGWRMTSSFAEEFRIKRCVNNINGKSILLGGDGRHNIRISLFDVGTGGRELIDCKRSCNYVDSAHDFVGSFVSIKGFKPPEAYGLKQLPQLRIFWPDPSPSRLSTNFFLLSGYSRKLELDNYDEYECN